MAARVFSDPVARGELELILHPLIQHRWQAWLERQRSSGSPVAFVVIPLLFERDYVSCFDDVVAIGCSPATQKGRLESRGWSVDQIAARLSAQLPIDEKLRRSDAVIWNDGDLACLRDQWRLLLDRWDLVPN
jgi:dephospho-CoA kinase